MDNQQLNTRPKHKFGFIYCYISPSKKRYIGQTRTTLYQRTKGNGSGYKDCVAFWNAIEKYGFENMKIDFIKEVPIDVINEEEAFLIESYSTTNPQHGYNIDKGGNQYISTLNSIVVHRYDMNTGEYLESFESIAEAARVTGVWHTGIRRALNGEAKTAANSIWKTEKVDRVKPIKDFGKQQSAQKVYMYCSHTGQLLGEYESMREASRETGWSRPMIRNHIQGTTKMGKEVTFRKKLLNNLFDVE